MQLAVSHILMLCIAGKAFASPPPHVAVSVKDDGFPEVVDLDEIANVIADADRFTNSRDAEWRHDFEGIKEARQQVQDAIWEMKSSNQSNADALRKIQEAKTKLLAKERSMLSVGKKKHRPGFEDEDHIMHDLDMADMQLNQDADALNKIQEAKENLSAEDQSKIHEAKEKLLAEDQIISSAGRTKHRPGFHEGVLPDNIFSNLDMELDESRRQIHDARAKLHSEAESKRLAPFSSDEDDQAQEAMSAADELLKVPSDLLPAPQAQEDKDKKEAQEDKDKQEALKTVDHVLNTPSDVLLQQLEEMDAEHLVELEQTLMRDLTRTIAEVDSFTQHHESQLKARLEGIQSARSQIHQSKQLVNKMKNPIFATKSQAMVLQEVKQAKAKLFEEQKAMFSVVHPQPVLSDHVINNLDDHLAEARQQIQKARARLAAEPPLFPDARSEEVEAPADHEQAIQDIRRDIRKVRAEMAQEIEPSVVRKERQLIV